MSDPDQTPHAQPSRAARKWFVTRFFFAGTLVPVILCTIGFVLNAAGLEPNWSPFGKLADVLVAIMWVVWPTFVLMIDVEHWDQALFMIPIAAAINGAWYSLIGALIWSAMRLVQRLRSRKR